MENRIKNTTLKFTCNEDWKTMEIDTEGRFCISCQKKVYDMTDKNVAYFIKIMQENNNNVCGRFTKDQMALATPADRSSWKRWIVAAMVLVGLGTLAEESQAQDSRLGKMASPSPKPTVHNDDDGMLMGDVVVVSMPPQLKALHQYLVRHFRASASTNGRLVVSFDVAEDGSFTRIALTEQLSPELGQGVLKVLKRAPKWRNYTQKANSFYPNTLYLTFVNGKIKNL